LLKVDNLRFINLCQSPEVIIDAYKRFNGYCCQLHNWIGDGEPSEKWADNYPKDAHIVLLDFVTEKQEAINKARQFKLVAEARNK
jgi:hypothetical protein